MDIFSAIIVVVPLITPIAKEFGVDPVHLGIIFLTTLEIGYSTPPVGINLFISSSRFKKPVFTVYRSFSAIFGHVDGWIDDYYLLSGVKSIPCEQIP